MIYIKRLKSWSAHKLAVAISITAKNFDNPKVRHILIDIIFEKYLNWRKLELISTTAFGSLMHLHLPDTIQKNIFLTGVWEPNISSIVAKSLKKGDIFIDIGANVGYYTLLASKLVEESGLVYSFEASPSIYRHLQNNIAANNISNTKLFNIAISDRQGVVTIWSAPKGNTGHSTIVESTAVTDGHVREAEIKCAPLSSLIQLDHLLSARLIKIDIEGAERLAIEGIFPYLNDFENSTEWLIELSPEFSPGGNKDTDWIFKSFLDAGYSAYQIDNDYKMSNFNVRAFSFSDLIKTNIPPRGRLNDFLFSKNTSFTI